MKELLIIGLGILAFFIMVSISEAKELEQEELEEEDLIDPKTEKIISQINNLPYRDLWGTRKELNELPNILSDDEDVHAITSGYASGNTWLMVATNKRVLLIDKGMLYGVRTVDIALNKINSISYSKGLVLGKIAITDGAITRVIENISNVTIQFFTDVVKELMEIDRMKNLNPIQIVNNNSIADELIKYKQLLESGVLTQEEFDKIKKEILNK